MTDRYTTDQQQVLADLARAGAEHRKEASVVVSPGTLPGAWAVKVTGHVAYNIYTVQPVILGDPGSIPIDVGQITEAVNLVESFTATGTLASGTYALMFRIGPKNVFCATP